MNKLSYEEWKERYPEKISEELIHDLKFYHKVEDPEAFIKELRIQGYNQYVNEFDKISMVINNTHSPDIKHISILDDKNEDSVHFKLYHNELRNLANFILNYLDNNTLSLKFSKEQVDDTILKERVLPEIGE